MAEIYEGFWLAESDEILKATKGSMFSYPSNRLEIENIALSDNRGSMKAPESQPSTIIRWRELKRPNHDRVRVWAPEEWAEQEIFAVLDAPPEW